MSSAQIDDYGWRSAERPLSAQILTRPIVSALRAAGASDILDAGCGNGALCGDLAEALGGNIVGVDADPGGIAIARRHFPAVRFETMTFDRDPRTLAATPDGRFDAVVSTEVVEHLYAPHELARFACDALRPGGLFLITTPYHGYLKNLALSLVDGWDKHHTAHWHGGHIKFWSRRTLSTLLEGAGFEIAGFTGIGRLPQLWMSMMISARKPA